ncbi:TetR/AcrR family transcriptional regulator [Pseudonocardia eucalypti]|uniref:TetR/AcrR family transcriptional regulator n=1 Tax=Pseudonocardia eucalypti TaxID=648755 RepID=A0ABP9RF34_9PSEU|nr:AcrR family transcriptional regulator [Pseudonocardia eucalypti]
MATRWGDRETRRRDILDAGRALLREKGMAAPRMREVARRAGIGLGTVYTYFATKESLYAAMYGERLDRMLVELEPVLARTNDLEELFVLVATAYRDVYAEFGKELDILTAVDRLADFEPEVGVQLATSARRLLAALRAIVDQCGAEEPELSLVLMWSTVTGLADHFTGPRHSLHRQSWDAAVRFAARTFVRGLITERTPG